MASTGNIFPSTGENVDRSGLTAWTNPGNIVSDNTTDATCNATGSDYLVARNFDFSSIPSGATILGILVRVEASEHTAGTEPLLAQLQDETATLVGSSKSTANEGSISGTAKAIYTYGSTSDVWGATLTEAIVKDADFGVRLWFTTAHDIRIDYVTMAVEYSVPIKSGSVSFTVTGTTGFATANRIRLRGVSYGAVSNTTTLANAIKSRSISFVSTALITLAGTKFQLKNAAVSFASVASVVVSGSAIASAFKNAAVSFFSAASILYEPFRIRQRSVSYPAFATVAVDGLVAGMLLGPSRAYRIAVNRRTYRR